MSDEEIEIEISAAGKVTVRTKGIKGPACVDAAETFARIIGQVVSSQLTSEYYEVAADTSIRQRVERRRGG